MTRLLLAALVAALVAAGCTTPGAASPPAEPETGTPAVEDDAVHDGAILGVDGGLDGGLVYVVLGTERHRIQQPRAMSVADVAAEGLRLGDTVSRLRALAGPTGSSFAVVPADGPAARLHLVVDGVLHPLELVEVERTVADAYPDAARPLLDHLRPLG